jgi:hypothetical protein
MQAATKLSLPRAEAVAPQSRGALGDKRRRSNWNTPPRCPPYPRNGRPPRKRSLPHLTGRTKRPSAGWCNKPRPRNRRRGPRMIPARMIRIRL